MFYSFFFSDACALAEIETNIFSDYFILLNAMQLIIQGGNGLVALRFLD